MYKYILTDPGLSADHNSNEKGLVSQSGYCVWEREVYTCIYICIYV
jgi:hypothetical protein